MNEIHEVYMYMVWSNEVIICVEMMDKFYVVCWLLCYGEMDEIHEEQACRGVAVRCVIYVCV